VYRKHYQGDYFHGFKKVFMISEKDFNQALKEDFKDLGLSEQDGFAFCTLFHFGLHNFLLENNLVDAEKCFKLIQIDEQGNYELIKPLFDQKDHQGLFSSLLEEFKNRRMGATGHPNNAQEYTVITSDNEVKMIFLTVAASIPNFSVSKAADVIEYHYRNAKPAMKLSNYLKKSFRLDYDAY
jgi:hypothetical protein